MKKSITEKILRTLIREVMEEGISHDDNGYRTFHGDTVAFGCEECISDLETRITDASLRRDSFKRQTDAREHYNGILRVLRRQRRAALKEADVVVTNNGAPFSPRAAGSSHGGTLTVTEQVVGYAPPSKAGSGDPGYETIGDTSVAASPSDEETASTQRSRLSLADKEDLRAQMGQMQQQRSAALKKGDSVTANHLGVQLQRMQDVLG
jgi:hypothetical protein